MKKIEILKQNKPIISFCIATYNRANKIYDLITEILKYKGNDIEVVVVDNKSTDKTKEILSNIKDDRFKYYENEQNLGGIYNFIKTMTKGIGDFIVFCTDKDHINHKNIIKLIDILKKEPNISTGYCQLNLIDEKETVIYEQGLKSLKAIAYLSKHPTGYFYKNDNLLKLDILNRFSDVDKVGAFPFELICSEMCLLGKTAVINIPLFSTETREEARKIKSYTYSKNKSNIYFTPEGRYNTFNLYVEHIKTLEISEKDKNKILKKVLLQELINATIVFKKISSDVFICEHHNMDTHNVKIKELFNYNIKFNIRFINSCLYRNKIYRIILALETQINLILKIIKNIIKKYFYNILRKKQN